jgi:hypothetical protein
MLFYLFHHAAPSGPRGSSGSSLEMRQFWQHELRGRQRQVGSLAGAAHLLNDNTGVLRLAQ